MVLSIIQTLITLAALFAAIFIPRQIMINQIYADLIAAYRTPEMGAAIHSLFHFYKNECQGNVANIKAKYLERYEKEINIPLQIGLTVNFSNALHFQRRMVAQFYFNMAVLRYQYRFSRLPVKVLKTWFTGNEVQLLSIILHMAEPANECFIKAGIVPEPPEDDVPMNKLICKLYEETEAWQ